MVRKWTQATVTHLRIQMRMCVAQRIGGALEQAVERPIDLQYEEYGAANRQRANEEDRYNHAFHGVNNPKLANVIVSQNRRTARNGTGIDAPVPAIASHLLCKIASALLDTRAPADIGWGSLS